MSDLLEQVASFVDISSVSRNEKALADIVEDALLSVSSLRVTRVENNVVACTENGAPTRILLGGHLDTVPPAGNERARIDGDRCFGCGAADMKGGLVVLLELAMENRPTNAEVSYIFYASEEIARRESGLLAIERDHPELLHCDAALLLEPTAAVVEAGCQGVVRADVVVSGSRAHHARPWTGVNAVHRMAPVLDRVARFPERLPVIDGCTYRESLQAIRLEGGVASNVVPDQAQVGVSFRFAPDRSSEDATRALEDYFAPVLDASHGDRVEVVEVAPAAPPALTNPWLARLVEMSATAPSAKLGWTDVAFFAERGIDAANFGPGDPELAHTPGEYVTGAELKAVYRTLRSLIYSD